MDGERKSNPNKMFYSVNWFATVTLFSDIKKIKKIKKREGLVELLLWALDKFKHVFWEQVQKLFQQLQNFEGLFMIIVERGRMGDSKVSKNDETSTFWEALADITS